MPDLAVVIFTITYLGVAIGRIPGLKLDRTGIALLALVTLFSLLVLVLLVYLTYP